MHSLRRQQTGRLVVPVPAMHATPAIQHHIRAKSSDDADHVLKNLIAPDFLGFFRCLGVAEIFRAREIQLDAIAASGRQQFLRANQSQLRGLLRAKVVLAAFAAGQREQRNIRVQASRQVSKHRAGFIIGMRGDVENARGHPCAFNGLHGFRQAWPCSRRRWKLRVAPGAEQTQQSDDAVNSTFHEILRKMHCAP